MRSESRQGFTIIELMVVVAVVAVILTIGIPQLQQSLAAYRLVASANLVAGELTAARTMAVSRANVHEATLSSADRTIQITDPNITGSTDPAKIVRTAKYLEPGVTFAAIPSPSILFYSRGLASSGNIVLQNEIGDTTTVKVNAAGKVSIIP